MTGQLILDQRRSMQLVYSVYIPGRAYVKKNSAKVYRGRMIYSPQYRAWKQIAQLHIKAHSQLYTGQLPFTGRLRMQAVFYFENHSAEPDLSALYEGIQDELQAMGVIENDRQIYSHDGSTKAFNERAGLRVSLFLID